VTSQRLTTPSFEVGGLRIDVVQMDEAVEMVLADAGRMVVHLCNAYTISIANGDEEIREAINRGDLNLADGTPVAWLGRWLGFPQMRSRVYGPDLMANCLDRGSTVGARHYLFGSTPEVIRLLEIGIAERWPAANVVGAFSPPLGPISDELLEKSVERMAATDATIVWVGLGTPMQDLVVERLREIGSHTYVAVGAAFDFHAGTKRQPPSWVGRAGLEWLFRLLSEPRRLWRRYLIGNSKFLVAAMRARIAGRG